MAEKLRRTLTLIPLTLYGVGTILGAGIYVIISEVAAESGTMFPLSFLVAAVVAGISSLSYAELSSRFPKSAGEAVYIKQAFALPALTILVGYGVAFTGVMAAATIIKGFYGYLVFFVELPEWICSTVLVFTLGAVAIKGVKESVVFVVIVTCIEVLGLALVILYGAPQVFSESYSLASLISEISWNASIFTGAFVAFFAFIGFEDMVNMAEETKSPEVTVPMAIMLALGFSTLMYFLVAVCVQASLSLDEITNSRAPLSMILQKHSSLPPQIMGLIGMVAIINGGLVQMIMVSRMAYGMARINRAPAWLGQVSEKTKTPVAATFVTVLIVWFFSLSLELSHLAKVTSFIILSVFLLVNGALIVIKLRKNQPEARFRVPIVAPIIGLLTCLSLLIVSIFN